MLLAVVGLLPMVSFQSLGGCFHDFLSFDGIGENFCYNRKAWKRRRFSYYWYGVLRGVGAFMTFFFILSSQSHVTYVIIFFELMSIELMSLYIVIL